mgnify:CR=1 FL=1
MSVAIDLTGQVCADQFEGSFYGGVSTIPDFHRGAIRSAGGKSIVCIRSTTEDRKQSRIRFQLLPGEGVALARYDVLVLPTIPIVSQPIPPRDAAIPDSVFHSLQMIQNTPQFNVTGHPAISVPCGSCAASAVSARSPTPRSAW